MSVGAISSPTTVLLRTVLPASWYQSVMDNINATFNQTYTRWVGTEAGSATSDWALSALGTATPYMVWNYDGAGTADLVLTLPLFYGTSTKERVSSVAVKIYKQGSTTTTVRVAKIEGMDTTATPAFTSLGSATSITANAQLITVSGLSVSPTADIMLVASVSGGDAGDRVYGARIAYSLVAV